jgi:hypothetical protein
VPSTGNGGATVVIGAGGDGLVVRAIVAASGRTVLVAGAVAVSVSVEPIDDSTDDVVTELLDPPISTDPSATNYTRRKPPQTGQGAGGSGRGGARHVGRRKPLLRFPDTGSHCRLLSSQVGETTDGNPIPSSPKPNHHPGPPHNMCPQTPVAACHETPARGPVLAVIPVSATPGRRVTAGAN